MPRSEPHSPEPRRLSGYSISLFVQALLMLAIAVISAGSGTVSIDANTVIRIVGHHMIGRPVEPSWAPHIDAIVWLARMPRILMAIASGAILAVSGAALQAAVRNDLADPYVLGVNSGASTGAALIITGVGTAAGGMLLLSGAAFVGAAGAMVLVLVIAGAAGASPFRLIMAGLAVGYALHSVTSFLIFASDSPEAARSVMFWLLGSLASIHWTTVQITFAAALAFLIPAFLASGHLDALAAGDDTALAVGIEPRRTRLLLMAVVSMGVGVVVAGAGSIGFVGLLVPHLGRALVGARHSRLLPSCALLGSSFLLLSDLGARLLFAPHEMAIGVVTGVVGAPFLLFIMHKTGRMGEQQA